MLFSDRLKSLRNDRNITQDQLSKAIQISRPCIAGYETQDKQPDYDKLIAIADFFEVTVDYLIGRSPLPNGANDIQTLFTKLSYENQVKAKERMLTLYDEQSNQLYS